MIHPYVPLTCVLLSIALCAVLIVHYAFHVVDDEKKATVAVVAPRSINGQFTVPAAASPSPPPPPPPLHASTTSTCDAAALIVPPRPHHRSTHRRHFTHSKGEILTAERFDEWRGLRVQRNVRLTCIINPETGHRLELDCYDPTTRIAVEYDGVQHYKYPNGFHRTVVEFEAQRRRDRYKDQAARREGIHLVRVPYWVDAHAHTLVERKNKIRVYLVPRLDKTITC